MSQNSINFVQQLNPMCNKMEWKIVSDDYDYNQQIATSCYGDMLHDEERNQKFGLALKLAIEKFHNAGQKAHVLDIGTGTGLLSMLAVKYGADSVVACEAFLPMANCAVDVIKQNNYSDQIKVVKKHSTSLTVGEHGDLKQKANILVSEVFDTELIGEGAIKTFNHAHEFLLEEHSIVIPSSGTVYAQIAESDMAMKWNQLQDWKDNEKILLRIPEEIKHCPGAAAVHDIQLSQFPLKYFTPLSPVIPVFRFDWMGGKPILTHMQTKCSTTAITSGRAQVVFMWWDLVMDTKGDVILSCAPVWEHPDTRGEKFEQEEKKTGNPATEIPWRDHWMQAIYYLPSEMTVKSGEEFTLVSNHDEFSFWFQTTNQNSNEAEIESLRPVCNCSFHFLLSRTRIGAINDDRRRKMLLRSLKKLVKPDTVCIVLGDTSLLPILVAKLGAKKVYYVENGDSACTVIKNLVTFNNVKEKVSVFSTVSQMIKDMSDKFTGNTDILIVSEPAFRNAILPWDNIAYWYLKQDVMNALSSFTHVLPSVYPRKCKLRACAVQFDDLWKISTRLNSCEGFSMNHFDNLIETSKEKAESYTEAQPLWEYPGKALTIPVTLFEFKLSGHVPKNKITKEGELDFGWSCRCDGVALWMEYDWLDSCVLSSGPVRDVALGEYISWDMFERQGVHLFRNTPYVDKGDKMYYQVEFAPSSGEFTFNFYFGY